VAWNEPTENSDIAEPTDPIDATEPTDPMDRTDPFEQIERTESCDHSDHSDEEPVRDLVMARDSAPDARCDASRRRMIALLMPCSFCAAGSVEP